jgi:hypothetical protein
VNSPDLQRALASLSEALQRIKVLSLQLGE